MKTRTAVLSASAFLAVAGVAIVAAAWAIGSVSALLADVPGVDNNLLRELAIAGIGAVFIVAGLAGAVTARSVHPARDASAGAVVAMVLLDMGTFLVTAAGVNQAAAQSVGAAISPVLEDREFLYVPPGDGRIALLVALAMGIAALGALLVDARRPAPTRHQESQAA